MDVKIACKNTTVTARKLNPRYEVVLSKIFLIFLFAMQPFAFYFIYLFFSKYNLKCENILRKMRKKTRCKV